ncbi:MAG TPA: APC family permease [Gemmatimonadaceae bacterium]|jgi:amino acid transporter|nr:APC family permease [Gemmatimonadaceae bacterium]
MTDDGTSTIGSASAELAQAEAAVEAHSAALKKELGVGDLVLTQILFIVGLTWIGVAGKLGPSHVVLWSLALVLFYLPSAAVVIYLNKLMPLEGGLYQWAKLGFNEMIGFMLAWNLWLYVIMSLSEIGLQCTTYLSYAIGPSADWIRSSSWFVGVSAAVILAFMVAASVIGLSIGKWVHNIGGVFMLIVFAGLLALPLIGLATGHLREYHPLRTEMPAVSLFNLNILGKLGFGALGGFEYVAILAGETRSPARSVGRSVVIAAPIVALMFVLGTSTVIAYIPADQIDLIGPMAQVLRVGFGPFGIATQLVTIAILMTLGMRIAQVSVSFTAVARLPMVAGWDRLLPPWFSRLHPKYRTPVNSILLVGVVSFVIGLLSLIGVGQAEAFQLIWNAGGIFYALTYLVMFAIPLIGLRGIKPAPSMWLKITSLSGLLMTALYCALSIFPIIQVASVTTFALKILLVLLVANAIGVGLYVSARRKPVGVAVTEA